jgi:arylsulfatase A-like enzyme
MSFPFRLEPGVVVESPSENVDLWPTLLDLLGLSSLDDADGRSRKPEILAAARGEPAPVNESPRFAHLDQSWGRTKRKPSPMISVSEGPYRLFRWEGEDAPELFDRSTDPYEQVDLAEERPEVLARMTQLAEDYLERPTADWADGADVEIDPKELEQLRALGYHVE